MSQSYNYHYLYPSETLIYADKTRKALRCFDKCLEINPDNYYYTELAEAMKVVMPIAEKKKGEMEKFEKEEFEQRRKEEFGDTEKMKGKFGFGKIVAITIMIIYVCVLLLAFFYLGIGGFLLCLPLAFVLIMVPLAYLLDIKY